MISESIVYEALARIFADVFMRDDGRGPIRVHTGHVASGDGAACFREFLIPSHSIFVRCRVQDIADGLIGHRTDRR